MRQDGAEHVELRPLHALQEPAVARLRQAHADPLGVARVLLDLGHHRPDGVRVCPGDSRRTYAIEHGQKTTSPESLAYADPLHLETVELGEVVHHGVLGEQLGEGVAANLDQVAVVVVSPEHLTTPT